MTTVFDTNILIDFENGNADAQQVIANTPVAAISRITWMEVRFLDASRPSSACRCSRHKKTALPQRARFPYPIQLH